MYDLYNLVFLSVLMFIIGIMGMFAVRSNLIVILVSIELMLLAVNLNFIFFSVFLDDFYGQIFSFFILTVAAAESAIGLAILVVYYRLRGTIFINWVDYLKG